MVAPGVPSRYSSAQAVGRLAAIAAEAGLRRVHFVAWRDLDDPEAGGSELHAHRIATLWAEAGIDVTMRTSAVAEAAPVSRRDGYRVVRRSGRYAVFPATPGTVRRGRRPGDGLVEIWNGMPFFSPLWSRGPRIVFLHHVHAEMWQMVLPGWLARAGGRRAPAGAARSTGAAGSSPCRVVHAGDRRMLGLPGHGSGARRASSRGSLRRGERSPMPLVVAVGRLVPVKRFDLLVEALVRLKPGHPGLQAVIVGEGYERPALEAQRRRHGAETGSPCPGSWPTRSWSTSTGGPGWWPPPRCAKAGG